MVKSEDSGVTSCVTMGKVPTLAGPQSLLYINGYKKGDPSHGEVVRSEKI